MSVKTYAVYYPPMSYPVQLGAPEGRSPLKWYPLPLSPLSNLKIFCQENHNRRYNFISIISPSQVYHNQKTAPFGFPPGNFRYDPCTGVYILIFTDFWYITGTPDSLHVRHSERGPAWGRMYRYTPFVPLLVLMSRFSLLIAIYNSACFYILLLKDQCDSPFYSRFIHANYFIFCFIH